MKKLAPDAWSRQVDDLFDAKLAQFEAAGHVLAVARGVDPDTTREARIAEVRRLLEPPPKKRGRPRGSTKPPRPLSDDEVKAREELAPRLRSLVRDARRAMRDGDDPGAFFHAVTCVRSPSVERIRNYCVDRHKGWRRPPEVVVRWILACHLGVGIVAVKRLISRKRDKSIAPDSSVPDPPHGSRAAGHDGQVR